MYRLYSDMRMFHWDNSPSQQLAAPPSLWQLFQQLQRPGPVLQRIDQAVAGDATGRHLKISSVTTGVIREQYFLCNHLNSSTVAWYAAKLKKRRGKPMYELKRPSSS